MNADKDLLRKKYKEKRRALSDNDLREYSSAICKQTDRWLQDHGQFEHFHLFFPIWKQREIDTFSIQELLQGKGKKVYTSRIVPGKDLFDTLLLPAHPEFEEDNWGIPVPTSFEIADPQVLEVIFIPLLVFDQSGNRIGFGKGYYDIFLSSLQKPVCKVGLSFFLPEKAIPSEAHDIPLDYCITPEKILVF